jgi:hypothetical protein
MERAKIGGKQHSMSAWSGFELKKSTSNGLVVTEDRLAVAKIGWQGM